MPRRCDRVILGGGIFGLHAARLLIRKGYSVTLIEADKDVFRKASLVNQARLHLGFHYPRSLSTALDSAQNFMGFCRDFSPAINDRFTHIYGVASRNSYTSKSQFEKFCSNLGMPNQEVDPNRYFKPGTVTGAYETTEPGFDAHKVLEILFAELEVAPEFHMLAGDRVCSVERGSGSFKLRLESGTTLDTGFVLNATYSGINGLQAIFGFESFPIKYELTEVVLGETGPEARNVGMTLLDGPFFSMMPYGHLGLHSLTTVEHTPHDTSHSVLPEFGCQSATNACRPSRLQNCNECPDQPKSNFPYMRQLLQKFMKAPADFRYRRSLYALKSVLKTSEIDDSRPTSIRAFSHDPTFMTVLSGKVSTIYELDGVL